MSSQSPNEPTIGQRSKRYKTYLQPGTDSQVPKTTAWRNRTRGMLSKPNAESATSSPLTNVNVSLEQDDFSEQRGDTTRGLVHNPDLHVMSDEVEAEGRLNKYTAEDVEDSTLRAILLEESPESTDEATYQPYHFYRDQLAESESYPSTYSDNQHHPETEQTSAAATGTNESLNLTSDEEHAFLSTDALYEGSRATKGQALLLLAGFQRTANLTAESVTALLQILSLLLPEGSQLPKTKYLFEKTIPASSFSTMYYCPECEENLDTGENKVHFCPICENVYDEDVLIENSSYYMDLPMAPQIRRISENHIVPDELSYRVSRQKKDATDIGDIWDGFAYQRIGNGNLMKEPTSLSLSTNWDGLPVFKSSQTALWTIQARINELAIDNRNRFPILCSIWFGKGKPVFNTVAQGYVNQMLDLEKRGITWSFHTENFYSKVYQGPIIADLPAKAQAQNFVQYNAPYGCSGCTVQGEWVEKGRGTVQVYPELSFERRTVESTVTHADEALKLEKAVFGVKGPTVLSLLPSFNVVECFVVDPMHAIDLGVMRQLSSLWFDSSNSEQPWYIGKPSLRKKIDERLREIRTPNNITRLPRSLEERAFWKAAEWRNFLLYYGPVVLMNYLPPRYLKHFLVLSKAVYTLSGNSITQMELFDAKQQLQEFVAKFLDLYGIANMTMNVHSLLHLADSVSNWGPLWAFSAYGFEGQNCHILESFNGSRRVDIQIVKNFYRKQMFQATAASLLEKVNADE